MFVGAGAAMLLWMSCAVLSAAVLAAVLRPMWSAAPDSPDSQGAAVYRDQLREIDAEVERGLLEPDDAEAARAEVGRRLLAIDHGDSAAPAPAERSARSSTLATVLGIGVPVITIALYLAFGSPQYADQPLSARAKPSPEAPDITRLVEAVEARLRAVPDDGQGWDVIAPVYLRQGNYARAAHAFARASSLLGETPRRLAGFAEATVLINEGTVTPDARVAYEKWANLEPGRLEPRFWLALADEQSGRLDEAATVYRALIAEPSAEAAWRQLFAERLAAVEAKRTSISPATPSTVAPSPVPEAPRGPSTDDVAAAEKLGADERRQMIDDMVRGLAERLVKEPRDLAGWQRLIRAYSVLGRRDSALDALKTARTTFSAENEALSALGDLARTLGLET